jgi:ADP-ribose pyrophosphatase YjhB (NUDIX family)
MKILINDIPVRIKSDLSQEKSYDVVLSKTDSKIFIDDLKGKVLIQNKSHQAIDDLLKIMTSKKYGQIKKIDIVVKDKKKTSNYLKSKFNIVEAAGGIVEKNGKLLLIFRRGKWDIPKGKLEKGESKKAGGIREVEEETGVKVNITSKLCTTWHTYIRNKKYVLKKTYWYKMECLDDANMLPQAEEDIEAVQWMDDKEIKKSMKNTFKTIKTVVKKYYASRLSLE